MDLDPSPSMMNPGQAQPLRQPHSQPSKQGQQGQQTQRGPLPSTGQGTDMRDNGNEGCGVLGLVPEDIVGFDGVGGVTEWADLG